MSKTYLDVQVPGIAKTYEFSTDNFMRAGKVKEQFISQISVVEGRQIFPKAHQVLFCSKSLEGLIEDSEVLSSVGIESGDTIILL